MPDDATIRALVDSERFESALNIDPEVRASHHRAEGYAWGYQDARGPDAYDCDQASAFARAYAICVAEFYTDSRSCYPPPGRAWQSWLDSGDVTAGPGDGGSA
ncbi:hypothetical protein [Nocardia brasiliensis]|uniref:hypothetical protein n=1 Tax=Nocardia brasiliensis TaxID=37326 RepID=UPI002458EA30|nr:hypothetical protein [Nocardia brasiliensis]